MFTLLMFEVLKQILTSGIDLMIPKCLKLVIIILKELSKIIVRSQKEGRKITKKQKVLHKSKGILKINH